MPLLCTIKQYGVYGYILEDPDPSYKRIFIENQAYDLSTLIPKKQFFQFQSSTEQVTSTNVMSANFYEFAPCDTNGKFGTSWSDTRTAWYGGIGKTDPWLLCLDYDYTPRRIFFDDETDTLYFHYYRDISTADIRADWWQAKSLTSTPIYTSTTQSYLITPLYKWRTTKENKQGNALSVVAFNHDNNATNIARFTYTPGSLSTYTNILSTTIPFLIGFDDNGAGFFINYSISTHNYDIYQINADVDIAYASSILKTVTGQGLSSVCYQLPSNITHSSDTRKVFYSGHWNASSVLSPKRIIWDKNTNSFYDANCTMIYPGANTYSNYGAPPTSVSYTADASNNWWMKPHVFQKDSNNYITFCTSEKSIHAFPTERWNASQLQRNWITYSIGSANNDFILTYHSHYSWPTAIEMPRAWAPISRSGDKIIVMQTGRTSSMEFSVANGWQTRVTQDIDARSYAIDSTGRIYLMTRGQASANQTSTTADNIRGNGWNEAHIFDPTLNIKNVNINIANTLVSFNAASGDPVESYLNVSAENKKTLTTYSTIDRFNPYPYAPYNNGYSVWFQSANSDRITSSNSNDFNFGTGNFTIEFYLKSITAWTSQAANAGIVGQRSASSGTQHQGWQVFRNAASTDRMSFRFASAAIFSSTGTVDIQNAWQHWAIVRNNGVITFYRDGVASGTVTDSSSIYDFTGQFQIGFNQADSAYYNGHISNLRICKGLAVYTGNFTVPTSALQSTQSSGTNISAITNQCVFLGLNSNIIEDNRPFSSVSLKLTSLNNDIKFYHGLANLRNEITVITSTTQQSNVPISILGSGPLYIKASGTIGPTWITPAGALFSSPVYETQTISTTIETFGDTPIVYSLDSGNLPNNVTLNVSSGLISGTLPYENTSNTYFFTIKATDVNGYYSTRQFSIRNNTERINWVTPSTNNYILDVLSDTNFSYLINAYGVLSNTITYTVTGTLPNGINFSVDTLSGNTTDVSFYSTIRITAKTDTLTKSNTSNIYVNLIASPTFGGNTTLTTIDGINYKTHTFTSSNTLTVTSNISKTANVLVVAGGAGGGLGGGGAGGYRETTIDFANISNNLTIVVGAGGSANQSGSNSSITYYSPSLVEFTATGGGKGAHDLSPGNSGSRGGSGGGAMRRYSGTSSGGVGNSGGYSPVEGYSGGNASSGKVIGDPVYAAGGGGGGASATGSNGTANFPTASAGKGGDGKTWIDGITRGGGGGGGIQSNGAGSVGLGGAGGGGKGGIAANTATAGQQNTGGGGGGGSSNVSQPGGSGVVIIRYSL